jgi:hypothetical protein
MNMMTMLLLLPQLLIMLLLKLVDHNYTIPTFCRVNSDS